MTVCSSWISAADIEQCYDITGVDASIVSNMASRATNVIYRLTAYQWPGECSETIYPDACHGGYWWFPPSLDSAAWTPLGEAWPAISTDCLATNGCGCGRVPVVRFDRDRIIEVTEVMIGTSVLADSAYRLDIDRSGYALTRIDGDTWPCRNDVDDTLPNADSWSVTYNYGQAPPDDVKWATAVYAAELVKFCVQDETCRLPSNTATVTTEGLQYTLEVAATTGKTGIRVVDDIIGSVNPGGVMRRARIVSPESVDHRRIVPAGS